MQSPPISIYYQYESFRIHSNGWLWDKFLSNNLEIAESEADEKLY